MLQIKIPQRLLEKNLLMMKNHAQSHDIWAMGVSENLQQNLKQLLFYRRLGRAESTRISKFENSFEHIMVASVTGLNENHQERFLNDFEQLPLQTALLFRTSSGMLEVFYSFKSQTETSDPVILSVPGAFMEKILPLPLSRQQQAIIKTDVNNRADSNAIQEGEQERRSRYDRLAGAVGMGNIEQGFELLNKARRMVVVVVGAGRAGSWLAFRLAQSGVGSEGKLILVDPDVTEQGNLDGMLVVDKAVGFPKVLAVGGTIAGAISGTRPLCINASLSDDEVLDVLKVADVVFTAVDETAVRLGTAVVASRLHIVHIDVTGGLAWTTDGRALEGGELRVFIPGSKGCLGCYDEYDWQGAIQLLGLSSEDERKRRESLNWHEQRPGSNIDVLLPVIGEALQSFWGILRGDVKQGFWYHYEKNPRGYPVWSNWSDRQNHSCSVCGDQGLGDMLI